MKAAPTPLFNYRKRQCQAILSDPQQLPTTLGCTPAAVCGQGAGADRKLPVHNPGGNTENIAARSTRTHPGFHHSGNVAVATSAAGIPNKPSVGSVWPNNPGPMTISGHLMPLGAASLSQQWPNRKHAGQPVANTQTLKYNQGTYKQPNPSNLHRVGTTSSAFRPQSTNTATSSASSMMRTTPSTKPPAVVKANIFTSGYMDQAKVSQDSRSTSVCKNQISRYVSDTTVRASTGQTTASSARTIGASSCQSRTDPPKQSSQNNFSGIQLNSSRATQHKPDFTFEEDNNVDCLFGEKTIRNSDQVHRMRQSHQLEHNSASPDMSMRIWTSTIAMMKSWAAPRDRVGLVLFEIFGVIDSAVVRDHTGSGKEFLLRDDTANVTCVFYEIDRDIPRLIRGQVCRVMGRALDKQNRLHVVSVRAALVEERLVCQKATQLSQVEMDKLAM
ncbi:hypothetical protein BsWGS_22155 [Bradybaena similaris]